MRIVLAAFLLFLGACATAAEPKETACGNSHSWEAYLVMIHEHAPPGSEIRRIKAENIALVLSRFNSFPPRTEIEADTIYIVMPPDQYRIVPLMVLVSDGCVRSADALTADLAKHIFGPGV